MKEKETKEKKQSYAKLQAECPRGRRPVGKKEEGNKLPRTHQVMGLNPWEVVTPKIWNPGGDFGLGSSPKRGRTPKSLSKKCIFKSFSRLGD